MSNHADSTLGWYIDWLKERNPEWSDDQRLEVATGFVTTQQVPERPKEVEEDEKLAAEDARKAERPELYELFYKGAGRNRKFLTGEELMAIITAPANIYRKLN